MSTTNPNQVTLRGTREREGLGKTPERTPPPPNTAATVMGMEHVKGLLEETFELRWEREERAKCAWTESTNDSGRV